MTDLGLLCCATSSHVARRLSPHPTQRCLQIKEFDFSRPGWSTATGHFTAVVWRDTARLGCAVNRACGWATYVCNYSPPGARHSATDILLDSLPHAALLAGCITWSNGWMAPAAAAGSRQQLQRHAGLVPRCFPVARRQRAATCNSLI